MDYINIAIKRLAFMLYSSGDLTNEFFFNAEDDGKEIQKELQDSYDFPVEREVYVKYKQKYKDFDIELTGFIDGINYVDNKYIIEEIKSTKENLDNIDENFHLEYFNQLKLYMACYAIENLLDEVNGRLTYVHATSRKTKSFDYCFTFDELNKYLNKAIFDYYDIFKYFQNHYDENLKNIKKIDFPYNEFRYGQKDFMKAVVHTVKNKGILYSIAPTGIGKTVSTLYPALKSIDSPEKKVMYLTGKELIKKEPIKLMQGFDNITSLEICSKEKMCRMKMSVCEPDKCPFAKGFFSKLLPATQEILSKYKCITKKEIFEIADKYEICPFEFSLHVSYFAMVLICDYNYAFDPTCRLIRYFDSDEYKMTILVDEAHGLVRRSKDMYSFEFLYSKLNTLASIIKSKTKRLFKQIDRISDVLINTEFEDDRYLSDEVDKIVLNAVELICDACIRVFDKHKKFKRRTEALQIFFDLKHFLKIYHYFDSENYRFIIYKENDDFRFKILCLNASEEIYRVSHQTNGLVFFSATMYPLDYYKKFLTKGYGEFIELPSPFKRERLELIFSDNLYTNYKNRENTVDRIVETINIVTSTKPGNYIVFFPSYDYLNMVNNKIENPEYDIILQTKDMNVTEREDVIKLFDSNDKTKVGFFVMGGSFSEGIDYIGDKLIGVIVIGVGIPQINFENDLLKDYCKDNDDDGFKNAYTYPGFNKVLQAIGRVIRSEDDKGVAIIMDFRITKDEYLSILPNHLKQYKLINTNYRLLTTIKEFWKK